MTVNTILTSFGRKKKENKRILKRNQIEKIAKLIFFFGREIH